MACAPQAPACSPQADLDLMIQPVGAVLHGTGQEGAAAGAPCPVAEINFDIVSIIDGQNETSQPRMCDRSADETLAPVGRSHLKANKFDVSEEASCELEIRACRQTSVRTPAAADFNN